MLVQVAAVTPSFDLSSYAIKTISSQESNPESNPNMAVAISQRSHEVEPEQKDNARVNGEKKKLPSEKKNSRSENQPQIIITVGNSQNNQQSIPISSSIIDAIAQAIQDNAGGESSSSGVPIQSANGNSDDEADDEEEHIGSSQFALTTPCQIAQTGSGNTLPRFDCIRISEPVLINQNFTIEATASDPDNDMSALTLGVAPYGEADFMPQPCTSGTTCTKSWTLNQAEPGLYTYRVKAKNELNQIITEDVVVHVLEEATTDTFIFRTAGVEAGPYFLLNAYEYINPVNVSIHDWLGRLLGSQVGSPFATFNVSSNTLYVVNYATLGYRVDADNLLFDEELPGCSSLGCSMAQGNFTTTCVYRPLTTDFRCTLVNSAVNDSIDFYYKPTGDTLGDNVIRVYNPMYASTAPVVSSIPPINFTEGGNFTGLDLDDYVIDEDNADSEITWLVSNADYVNVTINAARVITLRPLDSNFFGTDIITFTALDPDENFDSVDVVINVANDDNDIPRITRFSPRQGVIDIKEGYNQTFYLSAEDDDADILHFLWTIDGELVAAENLIFHYNATNGPSTHTVTATVSDGINSAGNTWTVNELDTAPMADFSVVSPDIVAGAIPADFVDLSAQAYDPIVSWHWNFEDGETSDTQNTTHLYETEGTYNVSLTISDSDGSTSRITKPVTVRHDDVLPIISAISILPDPVEQGASATIIAIVTDDVGVASVTADITSPSGLRHASIPLIAAGGGIFFAGVFTNTVEVGNYDVQLTAMDSSENTNTGSDLFTVIQLHGSGDSVTDITAPSESDVITVGAPFDLDVLVSAREGNLTGCNVTLRFDDAAMTLLSGEVTQILGDLLVDTSDTRTWQFAASAPGSTHVDVFTTCTAGEQSSDSLNITFVLDTDVPAVRDAAADPFAVELGDSVTISASVTDNVGVASVLVEVTYPNGSIATFPALEEGGDDFNGVFNATNQVGQYTARIIASDATGNVNDAATALFYVVDALGDVHTEITTPADNAAFNISTMFDVTVVSSAIDGDAFNCHVLLRSFNSRVFSVPSDAASIGHLQDDVPVITTIPVDAAALGVSDLFAATFCSFADTARDEAIVENVSVVRSADNPPVITDLAATPAVATQRSPVEINAVIVDDIAVDDVLVTITTPSGFSSFTHPFQHERPANWFYLTFNETREVGMYTVSVVADDTIGQTSTASTLFTVEPAADSGVSLTVITAPLDTTAVDLGRAFFVNASIAAADNAISGCEVTLLLNDSNLLVVSGENPQTLPDMTVGSVERGSWLVNSTRSGDIVVTVLTVCDAGAQSSDTMHISILPDLSAPAVQNVTAMPIAVELLFPITLSANVTDTVHVDTVLFRVTKPDATVMTFAGAPAGDVYSTSFGFTDQEGEYMVQVVATDTSGNINDSGSTVFYVVNPALAGVVSLDISAPLDNAAFNQSTVFDADLALHAVGGDVFGCDVTLLPSDPAVLEPVSGTLFISRITPDVPLTAHVSINASGLGVSDLTADVSCLFGGAVSDTVTNVSVTLPPVPVNLPPEVTITLPLNNSQFIEGTQVNFTGAAVDPEDGELSGASLLWSSDLDDILGMGTALSISTLSIGNHTILLAAEDSLGAVGNSIITVEIVPPGAALNAAPTANITAPSDDSLFVDGTQINFTGDGIDPEEGVLSDASLLWNSSLDGLLGTGSSLNISDLSVGNHTITLTVMDSRGATGAESIIIEIVPLGMRINMPPVTVITAPVNDSRFFNATQINFTGMAEDAEDGLLPASGLVWTSDLDGTLGTGASVNVSTLRIGNHTITLTARDSGDVTGSAIIVVEIVPEPSIIDAAPMVTLLDPDEGMQINNTQMVDFTALVTDDFNLTVSCSLYVDDRLNQSISPVSNDSTVGFTVTNLLYTSHTWRIECSDGHTTRVTSTRNLTIADTIFPTVTIDNPLNESVVFNTTVPLNYTVFDAETGVNMTACAFQLDEGARAGLPSCSNGTLTAPVGGHNLTLFVADNFGNTRNISITFTVDLNATITGLVLDNRTGLPVADAVVQLVQDTGVVQSFTTGADGDYTMIVPAGDYNLTTVAAGYISLVVPVNLPVNTTTLRNVSIEPFLTTGTLSGQITDANNTIFGATIELVQNDILVATAVTNASGHYRIENLSMGNYNMTVFKPGFTTHRDLDILVAGGDNVHNDVLVQNDAIAGALGGTVFDLTGTAIPDAVVTITRSDTGEVIQIIAANDNGHYQVNGLPLIFTYTLASTADGHVFLFGPVGAAVEAGTVTPDNDLFMS